MVNDSKSNIAKTASNQQKRASHGHSRKPIGSHSKTPASIDNPTLNKNTANKDKIQVLIQVPGEKDVLKVKIAKTTNIGDIKKYLAQRYGEDGKYIFISQLSPKVNNSSPTNNASQLKPTEKVGIYVKSSIGEDGNEAKLKVPTNIRIKELKEALAKKFGLTSTDFELLHISKSQG